MGKKLNADSIINELSSGSVFFQPSAPTRETPARKSLPIKANRNVDNKSTSTDNRRRQNVDIIKGMKVATKPAKEIVTEKKELKDSKSFATPTPKQAQGDSKGLIVKTAFYIQELQNDALDAITVVLKGTFVPDVDRSSVVRLLLEEWNPSDDSVVKDVAVAMNSELDDDKRMSKHKSFYIQEDQLKSIDYAIEALQKQISRKVTRSEFFRYYLSTLSINNAEDTKSFLSKIKAKLIERISAT